MLVNDILKLWTASCSVQNGNCESDFHQTASPLTLPLYGKLMCYFQENMDSELKHTASFGT